MQISINRKRVRGDSGCLDGSAGLRKAFTNYATKSG